MNFIKASAVGFLSSLRTWTFVIEGSCCSSELICLRCLRENFSFQPPLCSWRTHKQFVFKVHAQRLNACILENRIISYLYICTHVCISALLLVILLLIPLLFLITITSFDVCCLKLCPVMHRKSWVLMAERNCDSYLYICKC